jgi:O-antigen ligase
MKPILGRPSAPERVDSAIRVFLYILIFWLPYSPAVVETCVIISLILWVIKRLILCKSVGGKKDLSFGQKWVEWAVCFRPVSSCLNKPIGFFLIVCVLSMVSSVFFSRALHGFSTKTAEWFVVYFLVIEAFQERKHIVTALGIWSFTALATVFDSFIQVYFTRPDIFLGHPVDPDGRATAGFKTANGLGAYLTILVPFFLSLSFLELKKLSSRCWIAGFFVLSLWSLLLTYSRGALLGTGIGILFFGGVYWMAGGKIKGRLTVVWLCAAAALGIAALLLLGQYKDLGAFTRHYSIQWRWNIWQDCITMIKDRPVLGHGINTFMEIFQTYRRDLGTNPTYAHNCYLQLTAETGIAGLIGFLAIIGALSRDILRNIKISTFNHINSVILLTGLLAGILSFLAHSFFDTNFYSLQLAVYLWLMVGVVVALHKVTLNPSG